MKAHVFVTLKDAVLDPQGKAVHHALEHLGFENVAQVRQGKYFVIELDDQNPESAKLRAEEMAQKLLANPVTETFRVEVLL